MKKEHRDRNWISWIALGVSVVAILLWLCKYEPVTWTLLDSVLAVLSFVVAIISVLFAFNMFVVKKDLSEYVNRRTDDLERELHQQTLKSAFYIEVRMLHLATIQGDKEDIEQSIYMMLDIVKITKNKEDIDYILQKLKEIEVGTNDAFNTKISIEKLKIKLESIKNISCDAAIFINRLSMP